MKEKIANILTGILNSKISPDDIQKKTNLITDLGLTSLDVMYFILETENVFGIEIDLDKVDLNTFFVYKSMKKYIESRI